MTDFVTVQHARGPKDPFKVSREELDANPDLYTEVPETAGDTSGAQAPKTKEK